MLKAQKKQSYQTLHSILTSFASLPSSDQVRNCARFYRTTSMLTFVTTGHMATNYGYTSSSGPHCQLTWQSPAGPTACRAVNVLWRCRSPSEKVENRYQLTRNNYNVPASYARLSLETISDRSLSIVGARFYQSCPFPSPPRHPNPQY